MKINLNHFVNVNMSDPLSLLRRLFVKTRSSLSASLSAEEFIQNRHFILQILRKLLRKYQVEPKFIDSFLPQDAVYLILLMRIICDIQLQQKNHGERNVSNLSLVEVTLYKNDASVKEIEHALLLCLSLFVHQNKKILSLITQSFDNLKTIAYFATKSQVSCQILSLEILTSICSSTTNASKVLRLLSSQFAGETEQRFQFLVILLESVEQQKLASCLTVVLDLLNRILANVSFDEKVCFISELEEAGFTVQTLNLKSRQIRSTHREVIWEKIHQFEVFGIEGFTAISSQTTMTECTETSDLGQQVQQLFSKLEIEKRSLRATEEKLKDKCQLLMKNFIELKRQQSPLVYQEDEKNKQKTATSNNWTPADGFLPVDEEDLSIESCRDYYNVKSCEEETVCASVIHAPDHLSNNKANLNDNGYLANRSYDCEFPPKGLFSVGNSSSTKQNRASVLSSGPKESYQASKYFSYIMAKENKRDSSVNRNRSVRKSISRMFRMSRQLAKSSESIGSIRHACAPISRSAIASSQLERFDSQVSGSQGDLSFSETSADGSLRSLSLPNAFRSNFVFRKNSHIYYPQADSAISLQ